MAINVGDLQGTLTIKDDGSATIDRVNHKLDEASNKFDDVLDAARGAFDDGAGGAQKLLGVVKLIPPALTAAIGVALGLKTALEFSREWAKQGEALQDFVVNIGDSAEAVSRLKGAVEIAGGSFDQLQDLIVGLRDQLAKDPEKFAAGLKHINLELRDLEGLSPTERVREIALAFRNTADATERAAAAQALFGGKGKDAIALLQKPLEDLLNTSEHLGATWSGEDARAAEELAIKTRELEQAWSQLTRELREKFVPVGRAVTNILLTILDPMEGISKSRLLGDISRQVEMMAKQATNDLQDFTSQGIQPVIVSEHELKDIYKQSEDVLAKNLKTHEASIKARQDFADVSAVIETRLRGLSGVYQDLNHDTIAAIQFTLEQGASVRDTAKYYGVHAEQVELLKQEIKDEAQAFEDSVKSIEAHRKAQEDATAAVAKGVAVRTQLLSSRDISMGNIELPNVQGLAPQATKLFAGFGGLARKEIPSALLRAFEGGGSPVKAIGGLLGSQLGSNLAERAGGAITGLLGKTIGGALNSVLPGIGALAGPLLEKALGKLKQLFGGPSKTEISGREAFDKIQVSLNAALTATQKLEAGNVKLSGTAIAARDAYVLVGKSVHDADLAVRALLDAQKRGPEAVAAAYAPIQEAIEKTKMAQTALNDVIGRYKFTSEELGPALERQGLKAKLEQLYSDWQILTAAEVDANAVIRELSGSASEFIQQALRTGSEVPEALRPMLEQMAKAGSLFDAAGNKIDDLDGAGVKFALTMSEGFKLVVDSVKDLTNIIRRQLGLAIDEVAEKTKTDLPAAWVDAGKEADQFAKNTQARMKEMAESGKFSADEIADAMKDAALQIKNKYDELARLQIEIPVTYSDSGFTPGIVALPGGQSPGGFDPGEFPSDSSEGRQWGSPGTSFEDWGRGTPVTLHGDEAVVTRAQGGSLAEMLSHAVSGARQPISLTIPINITGVLNEGDLDRVIDQHMIPRIQHVIEFNLGSQRTLLRDNLGGA